MLGYKRTKGRGGEGEGKKEGGGGGAQQSKTESRLATICTGEEVLRQVLLMIFPSCPIVYVHVHIATN